MKAASVPSVKVKDSKYINWLKVTLALLYLKNGIHSFVESEVRSMHENLLRIIYGGKGLRKCTNCYSRDIRWNGRSWEFPSCCNLDCGKWLQELQKFLSSHLNPDQIFWTNSFVQEWPFNPWECAKIFLPQGQLPSNTGPCKCDSQALMKLLTNCQHFSNKLSKQGLSLTYKISEIRSNVMHSAAMEVSDDDMTTYIQQIICFLQDPVFLSHGECKTAVQKIKNSSLNVFLGLDLEITALNAGINEIRLELRMEVKKTVDTTESLKEEYTKLREMLENVERELKLHETRMDTIESDIQQQDEKRQQMDTAVSSPEVRLDAVGEDVQEFGEKLQKLGINTVNALQQQEKKHQKMDTTITQLLANIASNGGRLVAYGGKVQSIRTQSMELVNSGRKRKAVKEFTSDNVTSEALTKRRPESDGLRQLKNQTEDTLDTFRKMGFIPTTQTEEAKKLLQEGKSVVLKGNPGEGKTSTALHLIDNDDYRNQRVVISSPKQWEKVDTNWVIIVVLEDIFGQYDLDHGRLQEWIDDYLQPIQKHVDVGKLQVIITIRDDILLKAYSKLKSFKLFSSDMLLTLSSEKLEASDKMSILNRELQRNNKDINVDEKEQCIANFNGLIGFPQCCSLFAGDKDFFGQGPKFFKSPEIFLVDNITNLTTNSFLSLAFLFCNHKIEEEYLSHSEKKRSQNYVPILEELALYLNISFNESTMISLRESYDHYSGLYVKKVFSYENLPGWNVRKSCIQLSHATVYEAVGRVLGDRCPEMVVKYGHSGYLYQKTYTAEAKDRTSNNVFVPVSVYPLMAERMVHDVVHVVEKRIVTNVVKHSALKQQQFLMKLKDELNKGSRIRDFFMIDPNSKARTFPQNLSKGECSTFLQSILQSDEDTTKLVYSHFMEVLACTHNNKSSNCWQCNEKQKVLDLALYYHQFEIADKIITMNACYTPVSLCNAVRHGDLNRVQTILEYLKRRKSFSPECLEAKQALCRAYVSGNQDIIKILLQKEITLDSKHVVYVVRHGDINVLMKVVEHLKCHNKWQPHSEQYSKLRAFFPPDKYSRKFQDILAFALLDQIPYSTALYITYCNEKFDMTDYLLKNEVKVSLDMLANMSGDSSQQAVARAIQHLKATSSWDRHCDDASKALVRAYSNIKHNVRDLLIQEGVSLTMKNLLALVGGFQASIVNKAIQHLKDTDNWDPKCDHASEALEVAYKQQMYDACDLLIKEGISLTMKNLISFISTFGVSLESVKKAIQHLKDTNNWDPKCDHASEALEVAYSKHKYDMCDQLVQAGVSLTVKLLPKMIFRSLEYVKTAVKYLKDADSWDPKCDDASIALEVAYCEQKVDVCDLLIQEGVSLTMKNLSGGMSIFSGPLESVQKAIHYLKDTRSWDPKCNDASKALEMAYKEHKYDVCDLLVQEGVSLTVKYLPGMTFRSLDHVKTAVKHFKDTESWDPKCDDASKALEAAYRVQKYDVCNLLIQEGVSLKMKNLPGIIMGSQVLLTIKNRTCVIDKFKRSLETVKKALQHLKDTDSWDPKCNDASKALEVAYRIQQYCVCDLLVQEGISLTMKNFYGIIMESQVSLESVKKAIRHLKDTNQWDSSSRHAVNSLAKSKLLSVTDIYNLLIKEGVNLPDLDK